MAQDQSQALGRSTLPLGSQTPKAAFYGVSRRSTALSPTAGRRTATRSGVGRRWAALNGPDPGCLGCIYERPIAIVRKRLTPRTPSHAVLPTRPPAIMYAGVDEGSRALTVTAASPNRPSWPLERHSERIEHPLATRDRPQAPLNTPHQSRPIRPCPMSTLPRGLGRGLFYSTAAQRR